MCVVEHLCVYKVVLYKVLRVSKSVLTTKNVEHLGVLCAALLTEMHRVTTLWQAPGCTPQGKPRTV